MEPQTPDNQPSQTRGRLPEKRPVYDSAHIEELRKRLYSRGADGLRMTRHTLTPPAPQAPAQESPLPPASTAQVQSDTITEMGSTHTRKRYRAVLIIAGLIFFFGALAVSSFLMFVGGNTFSSDNITIASTGPTSIGGGEAYEFQISVANQNNIAIQSTTLIVSYPRGTRSVEDGSREITTERHVIDTVESGQLVNIPLRARVFGEENEEREISIGLEYRVSGSNATFEKSAEPIKFTITTSPVVLNFDVPESVTSGEVTTLDVIMQSNAKTPLTDILVQLSYPEGFDFESADIDTISGEDTWKFATLLPNEKKTIRLKGIFTAYGNSLQSVSAVAGVANGNSNVPASYLATAHADVTVKAEELDLQILINGKVSEHVAIHGSNPVVVDVQYKNTVHERLTDPSLSVLLTGSALGTFRIETTDEYDDTTHTVMSHRKARTLSQNETFSLTFTLVPERAMPPSSEISIDARISGTRELEGGNTQAIEDSFTSSIKFGELPTLTSITNYSEGPFVNTGAVPPVVGQTTQYTYLLTAKGGPNDLSDVEVVATLPVSVSWLDLVTGGDTVTFDSSTRTMRWVIGNMSAHAEERVGIQISFVPTGAHIGRIPIILEKQQLRGVDRFTNTPVHAEAPPLTTDLGVGGEGLARVVGN